MEPIVEIGELDPAEKALRESLEFEPDSELALSEMRYISRIREVTNRYGVSAIRVVTAYNSYLTLLLQNKGQHWNIDTDETARKLQAATDDELKRGRTEVTEAAMNRVKLSLAAEEFIVRHQGASRPSAAGCHTWAELSPVSTAGPCLLLEVVVFVPDQKDDRAVEGTEKEEEDGMRVGIPIELVDEEKDQEDNPQGIRPQLPLQKADGQEDLYRSMEEKVDGTEMRRTRRELREKDRGVRYQKIVRILDKFVASEEVKQTHDSGRAGKVQRQAPDNFQDTVETL